MIYSLLTLTAFFWGGTFIAGKLLAGQVPPVSSSFLRFFIATIALAMILILNRSLPPLPPRQYWLKLLLLGFTGVFSYNILFFTGLEQISAGRAALIIATTPLIITLTSALLYKEKLTIVATAGILLSLTGAVFVISNGNLSLLFSGGFGQGELAISRMRAELDGLYDFWPLCVDRHVPAQFCSLLLHRRVGDAFDSSSL